MYTTLWFHQNLTKHFAAWPKVCQLNKELDNSLQKPLMFNSADNCKEAGVIKNMSKYMENDKDFGT